MPTMKALNVEPFKEWLLVTALYQVAVLQLPEHEDIHVDLGEKLKYTRDTNEEIPCAKCAAGSVQMDVHYTGKEITVVDGIKMEHKAYVMADPVTQALWATMWEQGYVKPNFLRVDVDGDGQWDVLSEFNTVSGEYEPLMGIA